MIFPEIYNTVKSFVSGVKDASDSTPVSLDLDTKSNDYVTFNAINAGWLANNGYPQLAEMVAGGAPSWSGEHVNARSAMNHSVVYACNKVISETIGFLPLIMKQKSGKSKQDADSHPMYSALKNAPNEEQTAQSFTESLNTHCVLGGNAFSHIIRRSGTGVAVELRQLMPESVTVDREKTGQKQLVYVVKDGNEQGKTYTVTPGKPHDILHIRGIGSDGMRGFSVISMGRNSIGTVQAAHKNLGKFFAAGARVPYVLERVLDFKKTEDSKQWAESWAKIYAEPHRVPILHPGLTYKQIGLSARDAQMLEVLEFGIPEIYRWFGVSPHMVGDLSKATFSNIEQLALDFIKFSLQAWLTRWEQELFRCVLTPAEKTQGYYFKHNLDALLRGDFTSRMTGYSTMLQNGIASINEVRDLEDWNPVKGGDDNHIQLNLASVNGTSVRQSVAAPIKQ